MFSRKFSSTFLAAGFAALTVIMAVTGCGGGGGGPAPTPTPTPRPAGSGGFFPESCNATAFAPNYVSEGLLLHWPTFPLRVFFVRDANYSQARQNLARAGFNQWQEAAQVPALYNVVTDAAQANVTVTFSNFIGGSGDELGRTVVTFTPSDNTIRRAAITIGLTGTNAEDQGTAAHEWGHTLGITDHSPNSADLMFFTGNSRGCNCVTTRDLNTILTDYCGVFPRGSARVKETDEPTKTITLY